MSPTDLLIAGIIALLNLGLGILIGRHLRKVPLAPPEHPIRVTSSLARLRESLVAASQKELTSRLETLAKLKQRLELAPVADVVACRNSLASLIDQMTELARESQESIQAINFRIDDELSALGSQRTAEFVGLAAEKWFPQGRSEVPPPTHELRRSPRFPFPHLQSIAPVVGDSFPRPESFFDVRFRDISTNGFAFYIPQKIAFERLIARVGVAPDFVLVLAKVVHQTEVQSGNTSIIRVGCEILRRVKSDI